MHGIVDVAAMDVTTAKAGGGRNMWVGASGTAAEVATVSEVTIEVEILVDWDRVLVRPSMPALETAQLFLMGWGVGSCMEECSGRALNHVPLIHESVLARG
jgi:hypothetical protein